MSAKDRSSSAGPAAPRTGPGRRLVGTELALFLFSRLSPLNLVVLVRLTGPALDDLLPPALAALQERHPLLRARIGGPPGRPRFDVCVDPAASGVGPVPLALIRDLDSSAVYAVVEAELNAPFDPGRGPLARLTFVSGAGQDTGLVLTLHHAIADGVSAANLVHELLAWCRARIDGDAGAPLVPLAVPPPLTAVLPADMRGIRRPPQALGLVIRQGRDEISYRLGNRERQPVPASGRAVTRPLSLGRDATSSLVDQSRRHRLTLTSLLSAALLWQASTRLYGERPTTMRAVVWVDLRPHLNPPVASDVLACYASMLRFTIRVDPRNGFGALAAQVQHRIEQAARRGDRVPAALMSAQMARVAARWPVGRLGTTAVSYTAAPAVAPSYGPIEVLELRAFVSNIPLGAELAGACGLARGELWCNLLYLDSDIGPESATAIGDGLLTTLREFASA